MSKANNEPTPIAAATRVLALAIGLPIIGAECYGAYDYVIRMDGFSYLAVASPLAPLVAAFSLAFAERAVAAKQYFKAIALVSTFGLAACTVVAMNSERVHDAKAGNVAERTAKTAAAVRAETSLTQAKAKAEVATAAADKVRGLDARACTTKCLSIRASETAAKTGVSEAEAAVRRAQGQATTASEIAPPPWLISVALFFAGVVLVWYGTGTKGVEQEIPIEPAKPVAQEAPLEPAKPATKPKAKRRRKPKTDRPPLHAAAIAQLERQLRVINGGKQ
jgi:hypothetical protein